MGDPQGRVLGDYRVRWPFVGYAQRVTYLVGRNRKIRLAFHSELDADAHVLKACGAAAEPPG